MKTVMVGLAGIAAATMKGQSSLGSGFRSSSSVHYSMEGGLGGIAGGVSNASGAMTASSGSRVALVEMTQLVVSLAPALVNSSLFHQAVRRALAQCGRICWGVLPAVIGGSSSAATCG